MATHCFRSGSFSSCSSIYFLVLIHWKNWAILIFPVTVNGSSSIGRPYPLSWYRVNNSDWCSQLSDEARWILIRNRCVFLENALNAMMYEVARKKGRSGKQLWTAAILVGVAANNFAIIICWSAFGIVMEYSSMSFQQATSCTMTAPLRWLSMSLDVTVFHK